MPGNARRFVCVHGHFYQPPRENAWLEAIEIQDSAYPYHDWNERISAECYAPNAASRILDEQNRIIKIVNNYARISFNFGPTLLAWMEQFAPDTYERVVQADADSLRSYSGHGSALAQCYNHMIMPLANKRDQQTQVRWGIRDFQHRFGRNPEGMWLPETAVDIETLEALVDGGVAFTLLAPHQAHALRAIGDSEWREIADADIDTRRPYVQILPSGRRIALFFYDGPASRAIAFEGLLRNGERFAERLRSLHDPSDARPQLAHVATDGETYGHHHRNGDMALAFALQSIDGRDDVRLTNYAEYLERFPPTHEVRIREETSWSCAHGIERWRGDCGCSTGGRPRWNQAWRRPLREALDWLRDAVEPSFERAASALLREPWSARDDYIDVILDRSDASLDDFFERHARHPLSPAQRTTALELLEMQRHAMLMYTSCGWFFSDLSGIETVQVLQYAARVVQLAERFDRAAIEDEFLDRLESALSNVPDKGNGRDIYRRQVKSAQVGLLNAAAHHVASTLFANDEPPTRFYCYQVDVLRKYARASGQMRILAGRVRIKSVITLETDDVMYAVLHFGGQNLSGGVRVFRSEPEFERLVDAILAAFDVADLPALLELLARFPDYTFSFRSLFSDRKREILDRLLDVSIKDAVGAYRLVYDRNAGLMQFLRESDLPVPRAFTAAAWFVIDAALRSVLSAQALDLDRAHELLDEAAALDIELEAESLGLVIERSMEAAVADVRRAPTDLEPISRLAELSRLTHRLPFEIDRWKVQNAVYTMSRELLPERRLASQTGDDHAARWVDVFRDVGEQLSVAVD